MFKTYDQGSRGVIRGRKGEEEEVDEDGTHVARPWSGSINDVTC
jgi:hypothetical protein